MAKVQSQTWSTSRVGWVSSRTAGRGGHVCRVAAARPAGGAAPLVAAMPERPQSSPAALSSTPGRTRRVHAANTTGEHCRRRVWAAAMGSPTSHDEVVPAKITDKGVARGPRGLLTAIFR